MQSVPIAVYEGLFGSAKSFSPRPELPLVVAVTGDSEGMGDVAT